MPTYDYAFDPQCQIADNLITKDISVTQRSATDWFYYVFPEGPAFARDFIVTGVTDINFRESNFTGTKIKPIYAYQGGKENVHEPLYGGFAIEPGVAGTFKVQYHILGGAFKPDNLKVNQSGLKTLVELQNVDWADVSGVPAVFPPTPHNQPLNTLDGITDVLGGLAGITNAINNNFKEVKLENVLGLEEEFIDPVVAQLKGIRDNLGGLNTASKDKKGLDQVEIQVEHPRVVSLVKTDGTAMNAANLKFINGWFNDIPVFKENSQTYMPSILFSKNWSVNYTDTTRNNPSSGSSALAITSLVNAPLPFRDKMFFGCGNMVRPLVISKAGRYFIKYNPIYTCTVNAQLGKPVKQDTVLLSTIVNYMTHHKELLSEVQLLVSVQDNAISAGTDDKTEMWKQSLLDNVIFGNAKTELIDIMNNARPYPIKSSYYNGTDNLNKHGFKPNETIVTLTTKEVADGKCIMVNTPAFYSMDSNRSDADHFAALMPMQDPSLLRGTLTNTNLTPSQGTLGPSSLMAIRLGDE